MLTILQVPFSVFPCCCFLVRIGACFLSRLVSSVTRSNSFFFPDSLTMIHRQTRGLLRWSRWSCSGHLESLVCHSSIHVMLSWFTKNYSAEPDHTNIIQNNFPVHVSDTPYISKYLSPLNFDHEFNYLSY